MKQLTTRCELLKFGTKSLTEVLTNVLIKVLSTILRLSGVLTVEKYLV